MNCLRILKHIEKLSVCVFEYMTYPQHGANLKLLKACYSIRQWAAVPLTGIFPELH